MNAMFDSPVFKIYALCSVIVVFLLIVLGALTAATRGKLKHVVNPEDKTTDGKLAETEHESVLRAKRVHLNLMENAVPFFVMGLLYVGTNPSVGMAQGLFYTFVGARVLHAIFYLSAKQPWRTISFAVGTATIVVMAVQVLRAAI